MIYITLFTIIALLFSIHFYKNRYPNDFDKLLSNIFLELEKNKTIKPYLPILSTLAYNIIYIYSFCQITLNKTIQFCVPYIQMAVKKITGSKKDTSDSNVELENVKTSVISSDYDVAIIKSSKNDMIIVDTIPDSLDNIKYETSNVRFLALYLKMNEKTHIIELFNATANYYVVDNKFDANFFKYYLKNVLNIKIDRVSCRERV